MSFPTLAMGRPVIDVRRNAVLHLVLVNLVGHGRAGHARDRFLLLDQAAIAAYGPKFFHLVRQRMNEHRTIEFSAAARDVYPTFDLNGLSARYFVVLKLIRVWIRGGSSRSTAHFNIDTDGRVGCAVPLDVCHD